METIRLLPSYQPHGFLITFGTYCLSCAVPLIFLFSHVTLLSYLENLNLEMRCMMRSFDISSNFKQHFTFIKVRCAKTPKVYIVNPTKSTVSIQVIYKADSDFINHMPQGFLGISGGTGDIRYSVISSTETQPLRFFTTAHRSTSLHSSHHASSV